MPARSELRFHSELAVPLREAITASLPLSFQAWQELARANPATGSTVNEYKTSLQLPGTHLGIHRAATHQLFIKHCVMYHKSMRLSGVPVPVWPQGSSCMLSRFLCCTRQLDSELFRYINTQVRGLSVPNPFHDKLERSSLGSAFQNVHCPPACTLQLIFPLGNRGPHTHTHTPQQLHHRTACNVITSGRRHLGFER